MEFVELRLTYVHYYTRIIDSRYTLKARPRISHLSRRSCLYVKGTNTHKPESVMEECKRKRKQKQFPYSFIPRDRKETIQEGIPNTSERPQDSHRPRTDLPKSRSPPPGSQGLQEGDSKKRGRLPTLPHCGAVPSARVGLTSLFGMGRGGAPPP